MTAAQFRKLALSFTGAEELSHMNHPDFRVNGRIFATLGYPSKEHGCVMLTPEQQKECLETAPGAFAPAAGAWGRAGGSIVNLKAVDADALGAAMTQAFQNAVAKGAAKKTAKKAASR